ncbi:uncharacterized protein LOC114877607 isoform X2 [Osmia bicornis bicornis]|uniref:uncharacterized protein LOC114877607 isoform X2 n=1 Tax=Osmia bicornis bicornis TaxID=1437191 RepID=UPI001EAEC64B|nr:uncharacterized protein LOC114877607 isoform X2 [Osmia bicornis bicornis]
MMKRLVSLVILFCFYDGNVTGFRCFSDHCKHLTNITTTVGAQCLLTVVEKGEDCTKIRIADVNRKPPENATAKFTLRAYVYKEDDKKVTAFNLSITDIDFNGLFTRYQNLMDENQSACRHVQLYKNKSDPAPRELYVSCPFADIVYETLPYQLEYVVNRNGYKYSKQYIFTVPRHKYIEENVSIKEYVPFVYIDKTHEPYFLLHVQPLPETYNVSQYRIWWINNDTNSVLYAGLLSASDNEDITYNFTGLAGAFYFKVSPVHSDCGEYGCANNTTPCIVKRKTSHRLIIMIISTVWIPPVILYVLYHLYKLYQKALKRREKPKCLLVYLPSRQSHNNVMIELAKYLRYCHINAMIDEPDFTDTSGKDSKEWCNAAFQSANVVLIVTSPPIKKPAVSTICQNTDSYLLRLIKENIGEKGKRYYVVDLPYCKFDDVPEETRHLKRFRLPKELPRLVKLIHGMERVFGCFPSVCDKDFLDSVKLAKLEILNEDESMSKEKPEIENHPVDTPLLPDTQWVTNIGELNLLGESGEDERVFLYRSSTNHDNAFHINQLDL